MEREELKAIAENILLASDQPVTPDDLQKTVMNGTDKKALRSVLEELQTEYQSRNLQIIEVAGGYQLVTRHEYSEWIKKFLKQDKTAKLSQPSLDTLSIIAYKQPLTKQEVEEIRGVDSGGVVKTLLEKKIITPAGRKKVPGRPIMYRTTRKFLEYFALKDLSDLPTLEDMKDELFGEGEASPQTEMTFDGSAGETQLEGGIGVGFADAEAPDDPSPPEDVEETHALEEEADSPVFEDDSDLRS